MICQQIHQLGNQLSYIPYYATSLKRRVTVEGEKTKRTNTWYTILSITLYIARNVVFYCLCPTFNFYFCFAVALKGLVCKLAAEHQIRHTKRVDLATDVAVQVVSLDLGGVVYSW